MAGRDPTLTLKNVLNELSGIAEYEQLGAALDIKAAKVKAISRNRNNNVGRCKFDLMDHWLRSNLSASWEQLVIALQSDVITLMEDTAGIVESIKAKYLQGGRGHPVAQQAPAYAAAGTPFAGSAPFAAGVERRVVADGGGAGYPVGQGQPMFAAPQKPKDNLLYAQQLIEAKDEEGSKLVQMVLELSINGVDVDTILLEENNGTLLHHCAKFGDLQSVKALVALGANVNLKNHNKQTPLDIAKDLRKTDMVQFLGEVGGISGLEMELHNSPMDVNNPPIQEQQRMEDDGGDQMREEVGGLIAGEHLILSLDCSSTLALVQLEVLHQIEEVTHKKIPDLFEWIVASGVGGFLMMVMIYKKKTISELRSVYFQLWQRVFSSRVRQEDRGAELDKFAKEIFGQTMRMGDCDYMNTLGPKLLIGAVNKTSTDLDSVFFKNFMLNDQDDLAGQHVWRVARYTCSSLFIGECDNYVDGGVVYKNPSIFAFIFIREFYRMQSTRIGGVVSIGEGKMQSVPLDALSQDNYQSLFLPSVAATLSREHSKFFESILDAAGLVYQRFNPLLADYIPMPDQAKLEQIIDAVIRTIMQCKKEDTGVGHFNRKFNNLLGVM